MIPRQVLRRTSFRGFLRKVPATDVQHDQIVPRFWKEAGSSRLAQLEGISEQIEHAKMSTDGCESENDSTSSSSKAIAADSEKMSLTHLTQKFFMLFLVAPQCTLSLDLSAKVLLADSVTDQCDVSKLKTTIRRLYDIANILISLQLVQKLSGVELKSRKALFVYIGPRSKDMTATARRKQPFARHLSFDQICEVATIEREKLSLAEGTSDSSSLSPNYTETPAESDISTERLPITVELENKMSVCRAQSAPQRHLTCFLRTKSDAAISSVISSISSQLSSVVDAINKPLAVSLHTLSGFLQNQNGIKTGQGMHDIKLKKRTYQPGQSDSTQWSVSTLDTVVANSECCGPSVDSTEFQQKVPKSSKNDNSPQKLASHLPSSDKSSDSFQPTSAIYWNDRFAKSIGTSTASAVAAQKVSATGKFTMNVSEISSCTAVPLSTSNIVNVSHHPCSAAGHNSTAVRRRVILIKRRQNLP